MSFVSWQFAMLIALVVPAYWLLPWRGRIYLLWIASYVFYGAWDTRFLALLLTSTTIDFFCGLGMVHRREALYKIAAFGALPFLWLCVTPVIFPAAGALPPWVMMVAAVFPVVFCVIYAALWQLRPERQRLAFLLLSVCANLGVLFFFKYFNFFAQSTATLLAGLGFHPHWTALNVILPVAISFYTFQSISYSVNVYQGRTVPTDDYPLFATYLAFFPQLVAGPIERSTHLLPQFQKPVAWSIDHLHRGLPLILVGLFKKTFVADNCALLANYAFDPKTTLNGYWALLGVLAFAVQIYGDFSGYTDIARGTARLLGIELSRNFAFPYLARGPSDFWQRWHITLSTWFRDYVYIPLGGNRHGTARTLCNLWIAMLLAGLWHGASWTFVLWGAYHAALLTIYRVVPGLRSLEENANQSRWRKFSAIGLMFALTLIGWVVFRCRDLGQLTGWFAALANWQATGVSWIKPACWLLLHAAPLLLLQLGTRHTRDEVDIRHFPWAARGVTYAVLFLAVASSTVNDTEFIYFQF